MKKYKLTKSLFVTGKRCPKALFLKCNQPDLSSPLSSMDRKAMETGKRVQEAARQEFPDGQLIGSLDPDTAVEATRHAIQDGAMVLFEAAFRYEDVLIRTDILVRQSVDAPWELREVKATTYNKPTSANLDEYRRTTGNHSALMATGAL